MNKATTTLALAGLTLAVASIAAPAGAQTNLSFATAANFGISYNFGYPPTGNGTIGQTYYYKFLDVFPAYIGIGFVSHDLRDWATGPLTLYDSSYMPLPADNVGGSLFYTASPGLYYVSFYETTIGYLSGSGLPTTYYTLGMQGRPVGPTTLPVPPGYYSQTVIEDVPAGYVVPEPSSAWLLLAGLLPVGLAAARRRRA